MVIASKGRYVVCGNYALQGAQKRLSRRALKDLHVRLGEQVLFADFRQFAEVRSVASLIGGDAACYDTGVPALRDTGGRKFNVHASKTRYRG